MQIYGPAHLHGAQPIGAPHSARSARPVETPQPTAPSDEVNISDAARLVEMARQIPDIRQDRVEALRAQIAAGTYETDERLNAAVERLLDEIG